MIFLDTSVLLAYLDADDARHAQAVAHLPSRAEQDELLTTNYVVVETTALVQRRLGLDAIRVLHEQVLPLVVVTWVDEELHRAALSVLLSAGRRRVSFVDLVSFAVMRRVGCDTALSLDEDFRDQGFRLLP